MDDGMIIEFEIVQLANLIALYRQPIGDFLCNCFDMVLFI